MEDKIEEILNGEGAVMSQLRTMLAIRGTEFRDDSEYTIYPGGGKYVMLRTKWLHNGQDVSVIWGYTEAPDRDRYWSSYGAPERLECLYKPNDPDPILMTVDEIMAVCG